jgi:hypothetical protein
MTHILPVGLESFAERSKDGRLRVRLDHVNNQALAPAGAVAVAGEEPPSGGAPLAPPLRPPFTWNGRPANPFPFDVLAIAPNAPALAPGPSFPGPLLSPLPAPVQFSLNGVQQGVLTPQANPAQAPAAAGNAGGQDWHVISQRDPLDMAAEEWREDNISDAEMFNHIGQYLEDNFPGWKKGIEGKQEMVLRGRVDPASWSKLASNGRVHVAASKMVYAAGGGVDRGSAFHLDTEAVDYAVDELRKEGLLTNKHFAGLSAETFVRLSYEERAEVIARAWAEDLLPHPLFDASSSELSGHGERSAAYLAAARRIQQMSPAALDRALQTAYEQAYGKAKLTPDDIVRLQQELDLRTPGARIWPLRADGSDARRGAEISMPLSYEFMLGMVPGFLGEQGPDLINNMSMDEALQLGRLFIGRALQAWLIGRALQAWRDANPPGTPPADWRNF